MEPIELLRELKDLFSDPSKICKDGHARNKKGDVVKVLSRTAHSFSQTGAMYKLSGTKPGKGSSELMKDTNLLLSKACYSLGFSWLSIGVVKYMEHEAVMKMYDEAIRIADGSEG